MTEALYPEPQQPHEDGYDPTRANLRLSDHERLVALQSLGEHYASGRLSDSEFHERSGSISVSNTLGDIQQHFTDLPGGAPLQVVDGSIVHYDVDPAQSMVPAGAASTVGSRLESAEAELEALRAKGRKADRISWLIVGLTLMVYLLLQFVAGYDNAWIVWPSLVVTIGGAKWALGYSDEDEEIYDELTESESADRKKRLLEVNRRLTELEQGPSQ